MTDFQGLPYHEDAARDFIALLVTCCPTNHLLQAVPPQYVDAATHMSMWREIRLLQKMQQQDRDQPENHND